MTTLVTMLLKQLHMRIYFYFANIDASFMNESGLGLYVLKLIFWWKLFWKVAKYETIFSFRICIILRLFQYFFSFSNYRFIIIVEGWQFCRFPIVFVF